jgi:hypothetical protein
MKDQNLSKIRKTFKLTAGILLVVGSAAIIFMMNKWGYGYFWPFVAPAFGAAYYMLASPRSRLARLAKPLFPVANELINRQEQVNSNIAVVEKMGHTLRCPVGEREKTARS